MSASQSESTVEGSVQVVGVRHHSPACARLVRHVIERARPTFVLIEGPSDMNERLAEIEADHKLPIALYSYRQDLDTGSSRGMWSPFCDYSPEWVAIQAARAVGASPLFIDLPAWDKAFEGEENRYSDRHARENKKLAELCAKLGLEDMDALWEHLFEQPQPIEVLEPRLARYFEELRGDEPATARDAEREAFMAQCIAFVASDPGERIVVVCGGFHKPVLERRWKTAPRERPAISAPERARVGSYLIPFSFKRLDSFAGYASGMPSPEFHQKVWEDGAEKAAEAMLFTAATHLRKKAQRVSPADLIAAKTLSEGLRLLRGHEALGRVDVLDGLAGALVKDALEAPLPWTRRGVLAAGTDPMLVELVAAFSGTRVGTLAEGTPRPPLAIDAFTEIERAGIPLDRSVAAVRADLGTPAGVARSRVLHRLRILAIPGFTRTRGLSLSRAHTNLVEDWTAARLLETDAALIEAAVYGATLEAAAAAKLEEQTRDAVGLRALADALVEAALAGITSLTGRWLQSIRTLVAAEASFGELGGALDRLLSLQRGEATLGASHITELGLVIAAAFERGLWLLESERGPDAALDTHTVGAVRALRDVARGSSPEVADDLARAHAVCERRVADPDSPPAIRGAALGLLWSTRDGGEAGDEDRAIDALRASALPTRLGDFLGGLFALAREQVLRAPALLGAIDVSIAELGREDFFIALPALRQAFAYFPPRERLTIASGLVGEGKDPMALLSSPVDVRAVARGAELDERARKAAQRFGLGDALDPEAAT